MLENINNLSKFINKINIPREDIMRNTVILTPFGELISVEESYKLLKRFFQEAPMGRHFLEIFQEYSDTQSVIGVKHHDVQIPTSIDQIFLIGKSKAQNDKGTKHELTLNAGESIFEGPILIKDTFFDLGIDYEGDNINFQPISTGRRGNLKPQDTFSLHGRKYGASIRTDYMAPADTSDVPKLILNITDGRLETLARQIYQKMPAVR